MQGLRGCRNGGIVVPTEVIANAKEYIRLRPADPEGHALLAHLLQAKGDAEGARRESEQAARLRTPASSPKGIQQP